MTTDDFVTEGTSTNAWIVTPAGELVTRHPGNEILSGITRATMAALAVEQGISFVERPFTVAEAKGAREAFVTSATSLLTPVTQINDVVIGNGKAGSLSVRLLNAYLAHAGSSGALS